MANPTIKPGIYFSKLAAAQFQKDFKRVPLDSPLSKEFDIISVESDFQEALESLKFNIGTVINHQSIKKAMKDDASAKPLNLLFNFNPTCKITSKYKSMDWGSHGYLGFCEHNGTFGLIILESELSSFPYLNDKIGFPKLDEQGNYKKEFYDYIKNFALSEETVISKLKFADISLRISLS